MFFFVVIESWTFEYYSVIALDILFPLSPESVGCLLDCFRAPLCRTSVYGECLKVYSGLFWACLSLGRGSGFLNTPIYAFISMSRSEKPKTGAVPVFSVPWKPLYIVGGWKNGSLPLCLVFLHDQKQSSKVRTQKAGIWRKRSSLPTLAPASWTRSVGSISTAICHRTGWWGVDSCYCAEG